MDRHLFKYLFCMLTIFVGSSILFLIGFFPVSSNLNAKDTGQYSREGLKLFDIKLRTPKLKHDQVILMIIDAWRYEFSNSSIMAYSRKKACHGYIIKVDIPTVTMPRIKSITTGATSNFIDIVLNLGHVDRLEDSLLHRVTAKGKQIVFAGDRTWVKLFPNMFLRQNANKDSFYVNDFYEGDKNVTAAMKRELETNDWHLMILHYLGLDHIGHVEGSESSKIFEKLQEMDQVIQYITSSPKFKNKILIVTADHGMRTGGSHGGSDFEEIYVPIMIFSDECLEKKDIPETFNQVDIAPTLALLLGVDIPHSSVGNLISQVFTEYSMEDELFFYNSNAVHLMEKFRQKYNLNQIQSQGDSDYYFWLTEAEIDHKNFIESNGTSLFSYEKAKLNYFRFANSISKRLSVSMVNYDNDLIAIGLILTTLTAVSLLINVLFETTTSPKQPQHFSSERLFLCAFIAAAINGSAHYFSLIYSSHFLYSIFLTIPIAISIYLVIDISRSIVQIFIPLTHRRESYINLTIPWILLSFFLFHTFSLGSSSLIEEEHQTWYYLTPTCLVFLTVQNFYNNVKKNWHNEEATSILASEMWNMRFVALVMMVIVGCRRLNQTGDKWRHLEDIGDVLTKEKNYVYMVITFAGGLLFLLGLLRKGNSQLQTATCSLSLLCIFVYRVHTDNVLVLIMFFISVVILCLIKYRDVVCKSKKYGYEPRHNLVELLRTNLTCCLLVSALLHKPHNVILMPALLFTLEECFRLCDNLHIKDRLIYNRCYVLVLKTVITIFIANMFYFFQGNSNSLSTIDINPGFILLSSYNAFVAGSLITLNTYCAPINAFLYLMWHMFATQTTCLPVRQEKEEISNAQLLESTEEDLYLVISLYTATTVMPVAVYWLLLLGFRSHLFIYSVFAPKAFYECFHILVFYFNFIITNLYFSIFQKY